jgi:hypothetical protein
MKERILFFLMLVTTLFHLGGGVILYENTYMVEPLICLLFLMVI